MSTNKQLNVQIAQLNQQIIEIQNQQAEQERELYLHKELQLDSTLLDNITLSFAVPTDGLQPIVRTLNIADNIIKNFSSNYLPALEQLNISNIATYLGSNFRLYEFNGNQLP